MSGIVYQRAAVLALAIVPSVIPVAARAAVPVPACASTVDGGYGKQDRCVAADFSDAPASYRTGDAAGGPGHVLTGYARGSAALMIGKSVDGDRDGVASAHADSDDSGLPLDDEDGVADGLRIDATRPVLRVPVTNTTGGPALLAAWIDLDASGTFDADERASVTVPKGATSATLTWAKRGRSHTGYGSTQVIAVRGPRPASSGTTGPVDTFLRLRIMPATARTVSPVGYVIGGEVEDHPVRLITETVTTTALTSTDTLPTTGPATAAYTKLGLGLVAFGGSILGLAWLLGRRRAGEQARRESAVNKR